MSVTVGGPIVGLVKEGNIYLIAGNTGTCLCGAQRLAPEQHFVKVRSPSPPIPSHHLPPTDPVFTVQSLISTSTRLAGLADRESRTQSLLASLSMLNLNLPARVWLPLYAGSTPHYIVRIPPQAASVLNSKDKAPYIIYCEVVTVPSLGVSPVPAKIVTTNLRHVKSEERLVQNLYSYHGGDLHCSDLT